MRTQRPHTHSAAALDGSTAKHPHGYTDKEIADREQVLDTLATHHEEFDEQLRAQSMTPADPGYWNFALEFARGKLGSAADNNDFVNQRPRVDP